VSSRPATWQDRARRLARPDGQQRPRRRWHLPGDRASPEDLTPHLGPAFQQLLDDSRLFARDVTGFRLGVSTDLQRVAFVAYLLGRLPPGLGAVLIAPVTDGPPDGIIGIELLAGSDRIVAQVSVALADLDPDRPARLELPRAVSAYGEPLHLRVFARGATAPVRVLEWRRRRRGRLETRACAGFAFRRHAPPLQAAASAVSPGRPRVLAVLPQLIPSAVIGVVKPLTALHRRGAIRADITLEALVTRRRIAKADLVVFCRNTEPAYAGALRTALALGKRTIYELDDNFFEIPASTEGGRYHRAPERLGLVEHHLASASLVRVYSEALRERAARYSARVRRVDGLVDWSLVPREPVPRDPRKVRIVYATSRSEDELAAVFLDDLRRVLAAYAGRVEVTFWGHHPRELRGHDAVRFRPFVPGYDRFFSRFARAGFDIGLAPLRDDLFHRSKSDNKFREYAACRVAGIYSDVTVYSERVVDGVTGLLVRDTPGAWFGAMSRLIEDEALRAGIQERACREARERYTLERSGQAWLQHLDEVLAGPPPGTGAGQRGRRARTPDVPAAPDPRDPAWPATAPAPLAAGQQERLRPRRLSLVSRLGWRARTAGLLVRLKWQLLTRR
jgi:glycosyltransferase involved in cell wall biosynthesis